MTCACHLPCLRLPKPEEQISYVGHSVLFMMKASETDGGGRRRRSDAALNRARILDTARELLSQNRDVSMREVAETVGLGRNTVHRHFPTRDDLIDAVALQARDDAEADEEDYLRPAGELSATMPTPLSVADVLNKVPPYQLGEQIVAEAQRLPGVSSAAIYVVDLDGATFERLAGSPLFPARVPVPLAIGPEIPREGVGQIRAIFAEQLPGVTVAPLHLRGRAVGFLLAVGNVGHQLRELAAEAAVAVSLAPFYTDHVDTVRRTRPTSPAAEIQQNLLPPRIARIGGATLAGNVIPGYEIGGDWFDYAENPRGAWIGIADAAGSGARAAGVGAVTLGAFRATRRNAEDPAVCLAAMHDVLLELPSPHPTSSATVGIWNAPASTFRWTSAGHEPPILVRGDGRLEVLTGGVTAELGGGDLAGPVPVTETRIAPDERLLLLSDGVTGTGDARDEAMDLLARAVERAAGESAPALLRAIEDVVREHHPDSLSDDATLVVLAPSGMAGPAGALS
jgi:serine phosphatase RsbU (regulator of sigma subunit)